MTAFMPMCILFILLADVAASGDLLNVSYISQGGTYYESVFQIDDAVQEFKTCHLTAADLPLSDNMEPIIRIAKSGEFDKYLVLSLNDERAQMNTLSIISRSKNAFVVSRTVDVLDLLISPGGRLSACLEEDRVIFYDLAKPGVSKCLSLDAGEVYFTGPMAFLYNGWLDGEYVVWKYDFATSSETEFARDLRVLDILPSRGIMIALSPSPDLVSFTDVLQVRDLISASVEMTYTAVNIQKPMLSSSGDYLAIESHLSRPLTGHSVISVRTGKSIETDYNVEGYAPPYIYDWSRDDQWLLTLMRQEDPENPGNWISEEIWLFALSGSKKRRLLKLPTGVYPLKDLRTMCRFASQYVLMIDENHDLILMRLDMPETRLVIQSDVLAICDIY